MHCAEQRTSPVSPSAASSKQQVVVLGGKPREAKEAKLKPLRDLGPVQVRQRRGH